MATALGTLFELPLSQFGQADASGSELTAAALQTLQLDAPAGGGSGEDEAAAQAEAEAGEQPVSRQAGPTCRACGIGVAGAPGFVSAEEQRHHFSLDWHRFNVKRRLAGQPPVGEPQFAALLEGERQDEVGSISGSESEQSDLDEEDEEGGAGAGASGAAGGPQFAFAGADGKRYACWRPLVAPDRDRAASWGHAPPPTADQCLATLRTLRQQGGRWAVIMLRGGHFVAAVFNVDPARVANTRQADKFEALAHKSTHRYVVRAGQGGRQSAKDAGGKFAKSAGSRLRRYNEAALQRDVAGKPNTPPQALGGWGELLAGCSLIFVHAPSSNWQQLFGGEQPLLDKADQRIRKVPFTTRRPTFSESKRVMRILVTLYQIPDAAAQGAEGQQAAGQPSAAAAAAEQDPAAAAAAAEQEAAAATAAAQRAAEQAAAEEEARRKKAVKRARQKAKQKEERQVEAAASKAAAEEAARLAADDEIGLAAAAVAAMSDKLTAKPAPVGGGAGKASVRLSAKPRANEGADVRRARMAAAAEARMQALQDAAKQQQLR